MLVSTHWPTDGVYLICVLILAGIVCQTVSQSHQTLRKAFVDGVAPSRCSNRVWAQHYKTHTQKQADTYKDALISLRCETPVRANQCSIWHQIIIHSAAGADWGTSSNTAGFKKLYNKRQKSSALSLYTHRLRVYQQFFSIIIEDFIIITIFNQQKKKQDENQVSHCCSISINVV